VRNDAQLFGLEAGALVRVEAGLLLGTPGLAALAVATGALTAGLRGAAQRHHQRQRQAVHTNLVEPPRLGIGRDQPLDRQQRGQQRRDPDRARADKHQHRCASLRTGSPLRRR
jgi:hypothetical protein